MCPNCNSKDTIKKGQRRGIQRYQCTNCNHNFSSQRRPEHLQKIIFKEYFYHKQTLKQLAAKYDRSIPWIRKQIFEYEPEFDQVKPRAVTIVADATFFGKKRDKLGVLVFKDVIEDQILIWMHIDSEKLKYYKYLMRILEDRGFTIQGVTVDGRRGLFKVFDEYPVQMCLFHQLMIIKRYLTKNPKLQPSKELKKITKRLTTTTETRFVNKFQEWYINNINFINEKTLNFKTGKEEFTHRRLVQAFRSINKNLPYLFTYKNNSELMIPSTTNSLDGGVFSNLKKLMSLHQGMTKSLKTKLIDDYLISYNKKV